MIIINAMPELVINNQQTITGVQRQFNTLYPFLKIEFFRQAPIAGIGNARNKMIIYDMKISDLQNINKSGIVDLQHKMTVTQLEKYFEKEFGLYIQVFRKSGKIWLETTATDNWTLEQQNEEGKSLEEHLNSEDESAQDHDIY
jgi:hypothetical protein